ncbi:MAG: MBL fold metallo-hydrolase [Acidobacteriota bacterium]
MRLRFWGVRGSAAVPGPTTVEFGGNTSCVQLEIPHADAVLFDAGTGIRNAGVELLAQAAGKPLHVHLFLTHFHWDHIQGLPFFPPLFSPANKVTIYSSGFSAPLKQALSGLMAAPYFPITFESFPAQVELVDLASPADLDFMQVRPIEVNHPQGACAYRVDTAHGSMVYSPDREHGDARLDELFVREVQGTSALVLDSQYTPAEYEAHRGWGHSTWVEAVKVAKAASVGKLVLFHHDPSHSDEMLRVIEHDARQEFAQSYVAREGWAVEL